MIGSLSLFGGTISSINPPEKWGVRTYIEAFIIQQ